MGQVVFRWIVPIIVFCLLLTISCEEWDLERVKFAEVVTVGAIEVGSDVAFLIGDIEGLRSSIVTERGFVLTRSVLDEQALRLDRPGTFKVVADDEGIVDGAKAFAVRVSGLSPLSTYLFRAYIKLEGEEQIAYGGIDQFTTTTLGISLKSAIRNSSDCTTTVSISVELQGFAEGGETEIGVVWIDEIFIGEPSQLKGNITTENSSDFPPNVYIFEFPVECDRNYTVAAFATSSNSNNIFTNLRSFTTTPGGKLIPRSDFPGGPREFPVSFATKQNIYLGSGKLPFSGFQDEAHYEDFWSYSAASDSWLEIDPFPSAASSSVGTSVNDMGYFGTGQLASGACFDQTGGECGQNSGVSPCPDICHCMTGDFFKFDPGTHQMEMLVFSDTIENKLLRHGATALTIADKIYFGLGNVTQACGEDLQEFNPSRIFFTYFDFWEYQPNSKSWTELTNFPGEGRVRAVSYSLGNKGYIGLGNYYRIEGRLSGPLNDFYEFDPVNNEWKILKSFPGQAGFSKSFSLGDIGYILNVPVYIDGESIELWKFDRAKAINGQWNVINDNIQPDSDGLPHAALSIDNVAFIYLARNNRNFWMYVPELE